MKKTYVAKSMSALRNVAPFVLLTMSTVTHAQHRIDPHLTKPTFNGVAWPNATNTGVPSGISLINQSAPVDTGLVITADNTVIDGINLSGWINVQANNVTIQNSVITSNNWWGIQYADGVTGLKVLHNVIKSVPGQGPDNGGYDYGIAQLGNGSMEVAYNNISGFKDGVDVATGYVHDNYIHDLSQFDGAHTQNVYVWCGGNGVTLQHNTLINQTGQDYATAALYIAPDCGVQNNVTVDTNWLAGGSLVFYGGGDTATNIHVQNNSFSTAIWSPDGGFNGTVGYWSDNTGNVWSGNLWADGPDAGTAVSPY
ncbi:MAG TPA: hypothetical protein VNZ27_14265 [Rhodanobacter sp.]|nr:hypothetical protein [Rhodanobacter sp.]